VEEIKNASTYFNSADYNIDEAYWKNKIDSIPKKILQRNYQQPA
jgi:hypothetical protein